jgi:2-methylisocitrate lyase-like PEP mutase family enzyme
VGTAITSRLRELLAGPDLLRVPGCWDALSARLIERAGFEAAFMSGFAVAAARLALPDTGLTSYGELIDQGRDICSAATIPVLGDGDTGFGNALNVKRTVAGYAAAGFAAVMIEDQVWPKRCGHTAGKRVVDRREAVERVRAAADARDEGADILVLARTDARATHGLDEAVQRCRAFAGAGADIVFPEAPESESEMARLCESVSLPVMANMVEGGITPMLSPLRLADLGFRLAAYPLVLLAASTWAVERSLADLAGSAITTVARHDFEELRELVGFDDYDRERERYAAAEPLPGRAPDDE